MASYSSLSRFGSRHIKNSFNHAKRLRIRNHAGSFVARTSFSSLMMPSWSSHEPTCFCFSRGYNYSTTTTYGAEQKDTGNLSVAIVGTGPSGCYTAKYLISSIKQMQKKQLEKDATGADENVATFIGSLKSLDIDMIDRLPTPFGLVRR